MHWLLLHAHWKKSRLPLKTVYEHPLLSREHIALTGEYTHLLLSTRISNIMEQLKKVEEPFRYM